MPTRSEISIQAGLHWERTAWDRFVATLANRDLLAIVGFCALGLLLTVRFLQSTPDLDGLVASLGLN